MCTQAPLKTLARGLKALEFLAQRPQGCTNSEMARFLGTDRASSLRILQTLACCGFAIRDGNKYRISYRLLAYLSGSQGLLADISRPVLQKLAEETGFTATLAVWEGRFVVPIALEKGKAHLIVNSNLGQPVPPHASALGKVLLAFQREDIREEILQSLELQSLTPNTLTDKEELAAELRRVRERGFATDHEEYFPGVRCVAFPLLGPNGQILAAVSVSYPATSHTTKADFEADLVEKVRAAIEALTQRLGTEGGDNGRKW